MMEARDLLEERRQAIADRSARGRAACEALSGATDRWLAALLDEATGGDTRGLALVATGGYGRSQLAPGSDLDVWLLHDGRSDVEDVAPRIWYPVWDAGVKLGHAVRTPRQALALVASDLDTATAALSARHVAGDHRLTDPLAEDALERWRRRAATWLGELHERTVARHRDAGEVAFLLEPDLKEGRGGLRDVHALRWAEAARPVLLEGDATALTAAEDTLLDIRVALHRVTGRPSEELLLERQDDVAALLGDTDADALMARLATAARTVAWVSDEVWLRVVPRRGQRRRFRRDGRLFASNRPFRRAPRPAGPGVAVHDDEVALDGTVDPADDPVLVLRVARAAAEAGLPIARAALERLAERAPVLADPWPEGAREELVAVLAAGPPAIAVVEALDQRRLMERVLPEWGSVRSLPQRNALHRFTVDRHLLETVAGAAALTNTVHRPDLLLLGALLHDLGKGYPGDHTTVGVELAGSVGRRMGLADADVEVIAGLVRHHLLLPDVATRRDLSDPEVIEGVASTIGSLEMLELLVALTEADGLATGPSAWGSWRAELVRRLVDGVAHVLRGGEAAEVAQVGGFPDGGVLELMAARRTVVRAHPPELTVVADDRPGLFSRVAGALSLKGAVVVGADAHSEDGMAASRFRLESSGELDWDAVVSLVQRAIDGQVAVDARLAQRARTYRRSPAAMRLVADPTVRVDNNASATSTVIEVRAPDRTGVLYRITRALADLDLDIRVAKVATLGHEVVDTFYVRTARGGKIVQRDHVKELELAILYQLGLLDGPT